MPSVRDNVKQLLIDSPERRGFYEGNYYLCEGMSYIPHTCDARYGMNEVLIARVVFQKLSPKQKEYFWTIFNCAINCQWFHTMYGHTKAYQAWHEERVRRIYTDEAIDTWFADSPLKIKRRI